MQISVIVPVFNEASSIRSFLSNLRERTAGAEIIVVDGASTDATDQLAQELCDQVIRTSERSRAKQMNVGADAAHGDILWFVHADAEVPLESLNEIGRIMRDPEICGGFFRNKEEYHRRNQQDRRKIPCEIRKPGSRSRSN